MNAQRLLALYERVAEAPNAVSRLRQFVLDLAVRGRLVDQDPADPPASELLAQIVVDKKQREVSIRRRRVISTSPEQADEVLFNLPASWVWAKFGDITISRDGERVPVSKTERLHRAKMYDYYGASGVIDKIDSYLFDKPLLLIGEDGANLINRSTPIAFIARGKYWVNNHAHVVDGLNEEYLRYLALFINATDLKPFVTGTAQPKMNQTKMNRIPVAVPPLAEQHRILAKVDQLMILCDQLEQSRNVREDTRNRLTKASFARLTAAGTDEETFRAHAGFAVNALPVLTARADQVKQLRQTILNLAVRGRLVEQNSADEPLPCLDEKTRPEPEPPFDLPPNWRWSRLRALGALMGGGTPSKARADYWNGTIPWVSPKDMKSDYITATQMRLTEDAIEDTPVNLIKPQSILFVVRGMILAHSFPVAISRVPLTINQDMKAIMLKIPEMAEFTLRALMGLKPEMLARVQRSSHGTCRIAGTDYGDFLIPLPPLGEQHRIVAKVDELMTLCNRLESNLTSADAGRQRLLQSVLRDVLGRSENQLEVPAL